MSPIICWHCGEQYDGDKTAMCPICKAWEYEDPKYNEDDEDEDVYVEEEEEDYDEADMDDDTDNYEDPEDDHSETSLDLPF